MKQYPTKSLTIKILLLLTLILGSCVTKQEKEQTISISGAFALYPLVVKWSEAYKETHPEIRFNISGGGAGKGMADALSEAVDIGMVSREIAQEELDKGAWFIGLTIDAVLPTISAQNPSIKKLQNLGVSQQKFKEIFVEQSITNWSQIFGDYNQDKINVYTRSDACGAAGTWAKYLGARQEDLIGIGIFGDPALAEVVAKDPFSLGFNNTIFIYNLETGKKHPGIEVIPIDINNNGKIDAEENFYDSFEQVLEAIAMGNYPSPPARELYFVTRGKPNKQAVVDFMNWTLTEGQKMVKEVGYVPLQQEKIDCYLEKLK
ncbi:MAG: substrate-binding domain-containing protein [Bacteroidales bacterium]|nr:substrate-binding domain-containing protein [Bacteroidales bacterium]MBN2820101.1 substrate-binding domain-containing protein [Bacteroidales bacterium]